MQHSPYITEVILTTRCPHCGVPAKVECRDRQDTTTITHAARLQEASDNGLKVDDVYGRSEKKEGSPEAGASAKGVGRARKESPGTTESKQRPGRGSRHAPPR